MRKSCIPYIPYQSPLLSTIVLNDVVGVMITVDKAVCKAE